MNRRSRLNLSRGGPYAKLRVSVPGVDARLIVPSALRVVELDDTAGDMFEAIRASRAFLLAARDAAG